MFYLWVCDRCAPIFHESGGVTFSFMTGVSPPALGVDVLPVWSGRAGVAACLVVIVY